MKTIIQFQNYKKIRNLTVELLSGNIYFVKGSNNEGKTSFLQGLLTTLNARNPNKKALSFGASEGSVTTRILEFKGQDNENYTIKFDMSEGKEDRFTIVRPDTTVGKKVSDITSLFKYNSFTVDDWFAWGRTAEGRREQARIILSMLPDKAQKEFADIDLKINPRNGILFEDRKKANAIYESKQHDFSSIVFTDHETKMLEIGEKYVQESQAKIAEKEKALKLKADAGPTIARIENLKNTISRFEDAILDTTKGHEKWMVDTTSEIERLLAQVKLLKQQMSDRESEVESKIKEVSLAIENSKSELEKAENELPKNLPDIEELEKSIATRKVYDDLYETAKRKQESKEKAKSELQKCFERKESLTNELETLRKKRIQIIQEAKLPISNISVQSDEVFYVDSKSGKELPFSEENVSYAEGGYIIAQIMLAVNKTLPILMVGKAAEYDAEALDKLAGLAAKNDAIVILDRVMQSKEELNIECYEGPVVPTTVMVDIEPDALKVEATPSVKNTDFPFSLPKL